MPKVSQPPKSDKKADSKKPATKPGSEKKNGKPPKPVQPVAETPPVETEETIAVESPPPVEDRPVVYEKVKARIFQGEDALTADGAKELLGWEDEETAIARLVDAPLVGKGAKKAAKKVEFGSHFDLTDRNGKKVRLLNNPRNRSFKLDDALTWMQEILLPSASGKKTRWKLNGESMIVGQTGVIVSAQHRLAALVFASQEWHSNPGDYPNWETEPTLECVIVFGVEEDDETVNTIDTGRPRDLRDAIYRSDYFADLANADRDKISGYAAWAIKLCGERTNAFVGSIGSKRTHAESLDFLSRHPRLLASIRDIHTENGGSENKIGEWIKPGPAAALHYLMSCATSDNKTYRAGDPPEESLLDFTYEDKAHEFWTLLASGDKMFAPLRAAYGKVKDLGGTVPAQETYAYMVKCWLLFAAGKKLTDANIALSRTTPDEDGDSWLCENPTCGGIDLGRPEDDAGDGDDSKEPDAGEVNGVEERKAAVRKEKAGAKAPKPKEGDWEAGEEVWVDDDPKGEPWHGILTAIQDDKGKVKVDNGFAGAGKEFEVKLSELSRTQPDRPDGM